MALNYYSPIRRFTNVCKIGNISIGGDNPIAVQTMCNTKTSDITSSVLQINNVVYAGANLVRLTVPTLRDVDALSKIHAQVTSLGVPLCADVHFNSAIADAVSDVVEKVRVNPGNYAREEQVEKSFSSLLCKAKRNGVSIRIGVNHGSLAPYIMQKWGDTPRGMAESAIMFARIAKQCDFADLVISLKASNPRIMVESYRLCVKMMDDEKMHYPIHLGVTEAGEGIDGRIRSAVGIGALLADGIGDTIRVSLTEDPVEEIPVGKVLADYFYDVWNKTEQIESNIPICYDSFVYQRSSSFIPIVVGKGGDYENVPDDWYRVSSSDDVSRRNFSKDIPIVVSSDKVSWVGDIRRIISTLRSLHIDNPIILHKNYCNLENSEIICAAEMGAILIDGIADGIWMQKNGQSVESSIGYSILQAARLRLTKAEIISCPGCGRTLYDLQSVTKEVKLRFSSYCGLKIAVMGCIVNGPGEMADADWGYVGAGSSMVTIYKGHTPLMRVNQSEALDCLEKLIKESAVKC